MTAIRPVLEVEGLHLRYGTSKETVHALQGVDLQVLEGDAVALVGESGSGKSTLARALCGLLPEGRARIVRGRMLLDGTDVTAFGEHDWPAVRGRKVAMVFQDSMSFLNPIMRIGNQIAEAVGQADSRAAVSERVHELIELVRLAPTVLRAYPYELSGGMRQRVGIAIALACRPRLLIADEPTTALDVTTQAEILKLLHELRASQRMSLLLITHDLGAVRSLCNRVFIMYAGKILEWGETRHVFSGSGHPYVAGLMDAARAQRDEDGRLRVIEGDVPNLKQMFPACPFAQRCPSAMTKCSEEMPPAFLVGDDPAHRARCWLLEG